MPNFVKIHSVILEIKHECRHNTVLSIFVNFIYFTKTTFSNFISAKMLILPLCKFCCLTDLVFKVYNVLVSKERNSLIFRINYSKESLPPGVSGEEDVTRTGYRSVGWGLCITMVTYSLKDACILKYFTELGITE